MGIGSSGQRRSEAVPGNGLGTQAAALMLAALTLGRRVGGGAVCLDRWAREAPQVGGELFRRRRIFVVPPPPGVRRRLGPAFGGVLPGFLAAVGGGV